MKSLHERDKRIEIVNRIIQEIARRGRKFFYNVKSNRTANFAIGKNGRTLYFVRSYDGKSIYPYQGITRYADVGGGTLWALVNDFRKFIVTGEYSNGEHGYGGLFCYHWGYPQEDMDAIRSLARELGYLRKDGDSHAAEAL